MSGKFFGESDTIELIEATLVGIPLTGCETSLVPIFIVLQQTFLQIGPCG